MKKFTSRILRRTLRYLDPPKSPPRWQGLETPWEKPSGKRLIIVTGVGRNGTHWVSNVFGAHENTIGLSDPAPLHTAFFRYCVWNKLPIDCAGTFVLLRSLLDEAWQSHDIVCIASPYLGIGIDIVDKYLNPDAYILAMRDPAKVVSSLANKGWFDKPVVHGNKFATTGLQPTAALPHRHFSRLTPVGNSISAWQSLTTIGKCSWYWGALNKQLHSELSSLDTQRFHNYKLADVDQNPTFNSKIEQLFGLEVKLTEQQFLKIKKTAANAGREVSTDDDWSSRERTEFEKGIAPFYKTFEQLKTSLV